MVLRSSDVNYLEVDIAPLMRAQAVEDPANMQWAIDVLTLSNARRWGNTEIFEGKRDACIGKLRELPPTLGKVKRHQKLIVQCLDPTFWDGATEEALDEVIERLGPLMRHRDPTVAPFRVLDLKDIVAIRTWLEIDGKPIPKTAYQDVVRSFIEGLAAQSDAVRKVRDGGAVTAADIEEIVLLFEGCEHPISIENLREAWGAKRVSLEEFLAHILRGETLPDWETKVKDQFEAFIQEHSTFNARQIEMLRTLCTYVVDNEEVEKKALVAAPFTNIDRQGFLGVFDANQIDTILSFTEALSA